VHLASFLYFALLLFFGCRTQIPTDLSEVKLKTQIQRTHKPVVFVPGIKGSFLQDLDNSTYWLNAPQALGLSTPDLRLVGNSKNLEPKGAIDRITAIPYILDVAIYAPWLGNASSFENVDFYVFSYDWRKDNLKTRDRLSAFLAEIGKHYDEKPTLIGHSMGGMLSFSATNQNPKLVSKLVLVAVPFRGGIGYMKDLYVGNPTGLNSKIQSPCVIAKYETVYSFFPRINTNDSQGLVLDESDQSLPVDFFKESVWRENQLGFYTKQCKQEDIPTSSEFQVILNRAKEFRQSLDLTPQFLKSVPPVLVIHADNRPTRKAFKRMKQKELKENQQQSFYWDLEVVPREAGDGSVLYQHSLPPDGFTYTTFKSQFEHSVILNDESVQKSIFDFLNEPTNENLMKGKGK
jgi:pimeloyl-ACP methyl ester carboxylesterase